MIALQPTRPHAPPHFLVAHKYLVFVHIQFFPYKCLAVVRHSLSKMKSHVLPLILSSLLALPADLAEAVRLGLQGKHIHPIRGGLNRRTSLTGTTSLNDTQDINYTTNITLGGNQFAVIIDTGRCAVGVPCFMFSPVYVENVVPTYT